MSATDNKDHAKRPVRRWLARLAVATLVILMLAAATLLYASRHLADLARWGMSREFPNVILDLQSLEIVSPRSIEATRLVLKSRKDGATLLTLDKGFAVFQIGDLLRRRIGEVRLINPHIAITPRLPVAFASATGNGGGSQSSGTVWSISRLVCDYGDVEYMGFGKNVPSVRTKFACDFRNLSNGPDAVRPQVLTLWGLTAAIPETGDPPFLSLDIVTVGFSLNALLGKHEITSVLVKGGSFLFDKTAEQFLTGQSSAPAPPPAASPAFKIGSLIFRMSACKFRIRDCAPKPAVRRRAISTFN